jgi:hypothetical protein
MIMRALQYFLALLLVLPGVGQVHSEELRTSPIAVLELFTSQGCASCPPADELIAELRDRKDLVVLAYHVDYWDYIGWADTFGSQENSDFQRSYAASWGKNRIYTPQLVVNGSVDVVGSRRAEVDDAIDEATLPLQVRMGYKDGILEIGVNAAIGLPESSIWLVTFRSDANVEIERGENRGHSVNYVQIVTSRQVLGMWDPATGADLKLQLSDVLGGDSDGLAVIIQQQYDGLPGPILGAAMIEM